MYVNIDGQRIHIPLSPPDPNDVSRVDGRKRRGMPLCHNHQLRGDCPERRSKFDRGSVPENELRALALRCRQALCVAGSDCKDAKCIYGHTCPYEPKYGRGNDCRFSELHGIDKRITHVVLEEVWLKDRISITKIEPVSDR